MLNLQKIQELAKLSMKNIDVKYHKLYKNTIAQSPNMSFSGFGEDFPLLLQLNSSRGLHAGFYVDLGAYHPISHSNTFLLHLLGWRGLNVDANEDRIKAFQKFRPTDINVHAGVSDRDEIRTFYDVGIGLGSSFSLDWVEDIAKKHNRQINSAKPTQCHNVNTLFEKYLPENTPIDVLDIDLEGHDEMIINTLDWERYKPSFVLVELHEDNIEKVIQSESYKKLCSCGYEMISYIKPTGIFKSIHD